MHFAFSLYRIDGIRIPPSPRRRARLRQFERAIELGLPIPGTGRTSFRYDVRSPRCPIILLT
jgi:hypothetical protein